MTTTRIAVSMGLVAACLLSPCLSVAAPPGRDLLLKWENAQKVQDMSSDATLTTTGTDGAPVVRTFSWWRKLRGDGVHFATVTRFSTPEEIRGVALLFEERAGDAHDVLLYLPRFKKVRRIEARSQSSSFMGSALSYSDLMSPHVDDYEARLLREEACPDEASIRCYVVELLPGSDAVKERTGYSRSVQWIRGDNFVSVRSESFDEHGRLWKRLVASDIREVAPTLFFAHSVRVDDLLSKRFTSLQFAQVKVNTDLSDVLFTPQGLARDPLH